MDTFFEPFEENLVNIEFLIEEAKNYNLKLIDTKLFIDEQDSLFNLYSKVNKINYNKINNNTAIKEWESFHRWFIFQKIN